MRFTKFESHDVVESTMDIARDKVDSIREEGHGAVVMAEFQTRGRGRQGRTWFAPRGANVCMTAIGETWPANAAWIVALMAGVAAAEAVRLETGLPAQVRFPNDIYIGRKKLGGVLVETAPSGFPGTVVPLIGIGINVNVPADSFPAEISARATSILAESGKELAVGALTGQIANRLGALWDATSDTTLEEFLLPRWRELALPENTRVFQIEGEDVVCRIDDINAFGMVEITMPEGGELLIHATQIILGDE